MKREVSLINYKLREEWTWPRQQIGIFAASIQADWDEKMAALRFY